MKNEAYVVKPLRGYDAVIHAVKFQSTDANKVISATQKAGVKHLPVGGGAGSLGVAPSLPLVNTPDFPAIYKAEALAGKGFLNVLQGERDLDWSFLSPSAALSSGERASKFRRGEGDQLLVDKKGKSKTSMEEFAAALVDELENPRHSRRRFTVGD